MKSNKIFKHVITIVLATLIVACAKTDKQAELLKLKKQRDLLNEKIKNLEQELASDTTYKAAPKGIRVTVAELNYQPFSHSIEVQGKVDGDNSVNVFCDGAGGIIEEIYVKEGQQVSKGQILAKIDDKIYQSQLSAAKSNLEYVTTMYNKQKALWEQKIGSEVQYLNLKSQKESLESNVAALEEQISKCRIKSPISGTIEDIPIKKGQMVSPAIICFRVVNLSTLKIVADIAEGYSSKVNVGDLVNITLPDIKKDLVGKVDFCSRYINPTNRTFNVTLRIPSNDPQIKANMIAVLKIVDYTNPKAIVIPINLVQTDEKGQFVFITRKQGNDYVAKKAYVTVGEIYRGEAEIKSGLNPGDKVITIGFQELEEGQFINF